MLRLHATFRHDLKIKASDEGTAGIDDRCVILCMTISDSYMNGRIQDLCDSSYLYILMVN